MLDSSIFTAAMVIIVFQLIAVLFAISIFNQQSISKRLNKIIMNQEEFDAQITAANTALDEIATAITNETAQIIAYIESLPPNTDTSALTGVVDRLSTVSAAVGGVFEPPVV